MRFFSLSFLLCGVLCCGPVGASNPLDQVREHLQRGDPARAEQIFSSIIRSNPTEETFLSLGQLLGRHKHYQRALTIIQDGIRRFPQSLRLKNLQGLLLLNTGHIQEARQCWQNVLKNDPRNAFASRQLQAVSAKAAAAPKAAAAMSDKGSGEPTDTADDAPATDARPALPLEEQQRLAEKAFAELDQADRWELDAFVTHYTTVIERCPDTKLAVEACWRLANLHLLAKEPPEYDKAVAVLEHLRRTYPDNPITQVARGRLSYCYQQTGNLRGAADLYADILAGMGETDPTARIPYEYALARCLTQLGDEQQAQTLLQGIVAKDPHGQTLEGRWASAQNTKGE